MGDLLEREGDLGALRDAVDDAADGRGCVVLVSGAAGIGKSSLVGAFAQDPGTGARVLMGWCDDLLTSRTYGPFRDIARRVGGELAEAIDAADTSAVMEAFFGLLRDPLRTTVVILEDVHWADDATLDVVRFVGRRLGHGPGVLVLTYRDDELDPAHPLRGVIGALPSTQVRRVRPHPLSRAAVVRILEGTGLHADEVLALTGGNPFFVTEVAAGGQLPGSVADAVVARLRTLSQDAQRAVELLSVLPRAPRRGDVLSLVGDAEALAEAELRGLLVGDDDDLGFRHELARRAVYSALPVTRRAMYHGRVLDVLLERGAEPAAILHHAVGAGRAEVVAQHGPHAVHHAYSACANREAVGHAEHVLRYEHLLDTAVLASLLEEYAWSLYNLGRFSTAMATAERAVSLRREGGDVAAHARAVLTAARMAYMTNDPTRCFELIDVAERLSEELDDDEVTAETHVSRAAALHLVERHDEAIAEAGRASTLLTPGTRGDLQALVAVYRGGARIALGDLEGLQEVRTGTQLGRSKDNLEPVARCFTNLVEWLVGFRRWDDAAATIEEALAFYDDHDFRAHRFNTVGQTAWMHVYRGEWDDADRVLRSLDRPTDEGEFGVLEAIPIGARALLAVRSGAPDAEERVREAWDVARRSGSAWNVVPAACAGVEWAWSVTAPEAADEFLEGGLETAGATAWRDWLLWRMHVLLGRDVDPSIMRIAAERSGVEGGWAAGAASWERLRMPYERAVELIRSGEPEPTLEGLAVLDDLGAEPAARIARQRLRDLGVRRIPRGPQPSTRDNPMGLTDRQLEVLDLLTEGLTNAEIAERLVVSVRTVDHHVSAILQKLDVDNRQEAAEVATATRS